MFSVHRISYSLESDAKSNSIFLEWFYWGRNSQDLRYNNLFIRIVLIVLKRIAKNSNVLAAKNLITNEIPPCVAFNSKKR